MKTFFLTAWLWKGWSRWGFQPHNHKINGCSSKLRSEPTAGPGGNCPVHPIVFIFGQSIVAAFTEPYGHVKRQKPSYLFPVFLYIRNSSFRSSVETLLKQFHPTGTFFFLFFFFFLRKLPVILKAFMGSPDTVLHSTLRRLWGMLDCKETVCWCGCKADWSLGFQDPDKDDDF